jgi:TonB family protein
MRAAALTALLCGACQPKIVAAPSTAAPARAEPAHRVSAAPDGGEWELYENRWLDYGSPPPLPAHAYWRDAHRVAQRVGAHWQPRTSDENDDVSWGCRRCRVRMHVYLMKSGHLAGWEIVESSGRPAFDESALEAVRAAVPLPILAAIVDAAGRLSMELLFVAGGPAPKEEEQSMEDLPRYVITR